MPQLKCYSNLLDIMIKIHHLLKKKFFNYDILLLRTRDDNDQVFFDWFLISLLYQLIEPKSGKT